MKKLLLAACLLIVSEGVGLAKSIITTRDTRSC